MCPRLSRLLSNEIASPFSWPNVTWLNYVFKRACGHIEYVVVPEFLLLRCATAILRLALQVSQERLVLDEVLVTCHDYNFRSIKTID